MSGLEIDTVIQKIANRDRTALRALYARHATPVFSLARCVLGDSTEAEAVLGDTFFQVWREAASFDPGRGSAGAWVLSIARSRSIDRLRAKMGRGATREELVALLSPLPDPAEDPATLSDAARTRRVLGSLPEEQRQAVLLAYFGGWRHAEIAMTLGVPVAVARGHIADALGALVAVSDRLKAATRLGDLSLYALGDVSPEEVVALEAALAADPGGRATLRALIEAAHQLALLPSPSAPPPRVFDKIWKRIEADADKGSSPPSRPSSLPRALAGRTGSRSVRVLAVAAAFALAACLVATAMWYRERDAGRTLAVALEATRTQLAQDSAERGRLAGQVTELEEVVTRDRAIYRLLASADLRVCLLGPRQTDPGGTLRVIWRRGDPFWLVVGSGLPPSPAPPGHHLQLWGIREGQSIGAAVLEVQPDGSVLERVMLTARLEASEAAAVTIEPDGTAAQPTGEMIFFGTM